MTGTIVIGGGIVGSSVAFHQTLNGRETLLIDKHHNGTATDAGAGIISPATGKVTSEAWFEIAKHAGNYYPKLVETLAECGYPNSGYVESDLVSIALSEDEISECEEKMENIRAVQESTGYPAAGMIEHVDESWLNERTPALASPESAFVYRNAARVDGKQFAAAMTAAGKGRGLTVKDEEVRELVLANGSATGVVTDEDEYDAEDVVIAGGAWSRRFGDQLGINIPISPERGQIIHLNLRDTSTADWPLVTGYRGYYLVPWPDGRVAVGATREGNVGFEPVTTAAGIRDVLGEGLRMAPGLADAKLHDIRVGLRPKCADGLPVLGEVPSTNGVYIATGHGPSGLTTGPYSGKIISDIISGKNFPLSLNHYEVDRFV